ncbi:MAG TPA: winged helix-turn-helix domain-containing protein [Candidatus Dormibacteraeota bacterium]|jgi:DNA-binding winged helix-turn-helix (wHTH) protein|nr:winged helix-turn-helix domain-containing protein [Candidatus Dormibacteraeota bacterium]
MNAEMAGMQSLAGRSYTETKEEETRRFLSFGNFTVDLKREELFKDGTRVKMPGKVYQTLVALLDRPGEVVSREDLRAKLWPEGTHVNYDANVNTTVNKLRLALGDSPDKPAYVETIPRQGYSFVGSVSEVAAHASIRNGSARATGAVVVEQLAGVEAHVEESGLGRPSTWFIAGVIALVLAGILFGAATVIYLHRSV